MIDRTSSLQLIVDGVEIAAMPGDTVASAMLAAGLLRVGSGIYSGRPRGLVSIGNDEPNAFVRVLSGAGESMARTTELEVYDGLRVEFLQGRGRLEVDPDESRCDHRWAHAGVLVVGAGAAGLAATLEAARTGVRVCLIDEQVLPGGWSIESPTPTMAAQLGEIVAMPNVEILSRTTVVGLYDHGHVVAVERRGDHLADAPSSLARRRLWHILAAEVVLATGANERPIAFPDNDRPGIMLSGAAVAYIRRFGVVPGDQAVLWTAHDGGLYDALDLAAAGLKMAAVLDVRAQVAPWFVEAFDRLAVPLWAAASVVGTDADGSGALRRVHVRDHVRAEVYDADLLAVSGGLNRALSLYSQAGGKLAWSETAAGFVAGVAPANAAYPVRLVGAAAGEMDLVPGRPERTPPASWFMGDISNEVAGRVYLDSHREVTLDDVRRAQAAGMTSIEHIKRFTTLGTGADQGRLSGVVAAGVVATELGVAVSAVGTTTYRPPLVPISFGLLAGRRRGDLVDPIRVTSIHDRHVALGVPFEDVGQWKRPWYYPMPGEAFDDAVARECRAVRTAVGMTDASTLGKIVCHGKDVGEFLDRIYTGLFSNLAVGKIRYGVMCGPDGMVFDDGTVARINELEWLMSTTTGNAASVMDMLEEWHMTEWPDLDVRFTSVTEQWSVVAVAGPLSRDVLQALVVDLDVSNEAFGFMEWRDAQVMDIPVRFMRISFSGELAYELHVPSWYGGALWDAVAAAGQPFGMTAYGTETMHVLRAEKGFAIIGQETDGTVTPMDLGMAWAISPKKLREGRDFLGARSLSRADTQRADRRQLVGLVPVDGVTPLVEGAQIVRAGADLTSLPVPMLGHVTSAYFSPVLASPFGLALLEDGRARIGQTIDTVHNLNPVRARVLDPVLVDPEGSRRDG